MRVLVAAASKHGSTREIAERISQGLARAGHMAVAKDVDEVLGLEDVDAVVLGSAVYAGRWIGDARQLATALSTKLRARPVWLFSSGPVGSTPRVPADDVVDLDSLIAEVGAREHRLFAGKIDLEQLGFIERSVVRALRVKSGDYRDWDEIDAWAAGIAGELSRIDAADAGEVAA